MMDGDNAEAASEQIKAFQDQRVVHAWDPNRRLGDLYARTLRLRATAWDIYLLYASGVRWAGNEPPEPTFWMYQLPTDAGVDGELLLNPAISSRELRRLLGNGTQGSGADLPLQLHAKGLFNVKRERDISSLEELAESIEDPATQTVAEEFRGESRET